MVRRGSTVRVRQRASLKCLQIGTLLLSILRTREHRTDTYLTRDAPRRFATPSDPSFRQDSIALISEIPAKGLRSLSELARERPPLHGEGVDGSIPSNAQSRAHGLFGELTTNAALRGSRADPARIQRAGARRHRHEPGGPARSLWPGDERSPFVPRF